MVLCPHGTIRTKITKKAQFQGKRRFEVPTAENDKFDQAHQPFSQPFFRQKNMETCGLP